MEKVQFEWDERKDSENQRKHGVSFALAQYAFGDPDRVIAKDIGHSQVERRYYCIGKVGDGIMTDTLPIGRAKSGLLVPVTGGKERISTMRKGHRYTDEPLGRIEVIRDFLPDPSELVYKEDTVKVTLGLSRRSVDFFK